MLTFESKQPWNQQELTNYETCINTTSKSIQLWDDPFVLIFILKCDFVTNEKAASGEKAYWFSAHSPEVGRLRGALCLLIFGLICVQTRRLVMSDQWLGQSRVSLPVLIFHSYKGSLHHLCTSSETLSPCFVFKIIHWTGWSLWKTSHKPLKSISFHQAWWHSVPLPNRPLRELVTRFRDSNQAWKDVHNKDSVALYPKCSDF